MEIVYVDWSPIIKKSMIYKGSQIRRYYSWEAINMSSDRVIPFRKKNGNIDLKAVISIFKKDSKIWVEYGCGGMAHIIVLIAAYIVPKKVIILNVHDVYKIQIDTYGSYFFLNKIRHEIIEKLLLYKAKFIILAWPRLLDYFQPRKEQKILIMPPGVGIDEFHPPHTSEKKIKTAIYFGSIRRKGILLDVMKLFSEINDWELLIMGEQEGIKIEAIKNISYLGIISHQNVQIYLQTADAIIIALPDYEYINKTMQIRLGYALNSCKPVIVPKLMGLSEYVSMLGLENNVIYIDKWNIDNLKESLQMAQILHINSDETIEKLRCMAWEPRFKKVMEICFMNNQKSIKQIEWV